MSNPIKKAYRNTLKTAKKANRADRKEIKASHKAYEKDIQAVGKTRAKGAKMEASGIRKQERAATKMSKKTGVYSARPRRQATLRQRGASGEVKADTGRKMQADPRKAMAEGKGPTRHEKRVITPEGKTITPRKGRKRLYGKK